MARGGGRNRAGNDKRASSIRRGWGEWSDAPIPAAIDPVESDDASDAESAVGAGEEPDGVEASERESDSEESGLDSDGGSVAVAGDAELDAEVERAKRRAREEMAAGDWDKHGYAALDLDEVLGPAEGNCKRVHIRELTSATFEEHYEQAPCIIEGMLEGWEARHWTPASLAERFGGARFKCGDTEAGEKVTLSLRSYCRYVETQRDDAPLYVFDEDFADEHRCARGRIEAAVGGTEGGAVGEGGRSLRCSGVPSHGRF
jgi:hypothetical protein